MVSMDTSWYINKCVQFGYIVTSVNWIVITILRIYFKIFGGCYNYFVVVSEMLILVLTHSRRDLLNVLYF